MTVPRTGPRGRQLSVFGVEAAEVSPLDLSGLLAGPGTLSRMGGTARVSVTVDAAWRVHVLVAELAARGLEVSWRPLSAATAVDDEPAELAAEPIDHEAAAEWAAYENAAGWVEGDSAVEAVDDGAEVPATSPGPADRAAVAGEVSADVTLGDLGTEDPAAVGVGVRQPAGGGFEVRTAYSRLLAPLAAAWSRGAPRSFYLNGPRLRLWTAAGGGLGPAGWALRAPDEPARDAAGAALARAGLPSTLVGGDPAVFRITGRRRLARLAELVGERPPAAPPEGWPTPCE